MKILDRVISDWLEDRIIEVDDSGGYALAVQPLPMAETNPGADRYYQKHEYVQMPIGKMPGTPLVFRTTKGAAADMARLIERWSAVAAAAGMASAQQSGSMPAAWKDLFAAIDCEFVTDPRLVYPCAATVQIYCFGEARVYHLWQMVRKGGRLPTAGRVRRVLTRVGLSACLQCT